MEQKKELTEEQILKFWKKNKIYEKSKKQNAKGKKFYLMDGPPYATGHIHMGTALNKISKDIILRSHRLQGFNVFDRAGYDTHGLPIEFQVEKEIGAKTKQDIEKFGVKKFIEKCKKFATRFIDTQTAEFENLGVWMNFKDPYLTLDNTYIETIWDTFKIADKKNLLYLGKYPVHVCPRCETAVAFNEIEYAKQEDNSIFVKFPLKNKKNTYLIIWTTTPWTLPANTGIMVHPNFTYQKIEVSSGEKWIIAKELVSKIMAEIKTSFTPKEEFKGKEMQGWNYENPLSKHLNLKLNPKNSYKVVLSSRYINLEEGTGLVHVAPGHGKEDYEVGGKEKLEAPSPVNISGTMTKEAGKYAGKKARIVDKEIIEDLEKDNALVYELKYTHDYPFCWRCKSALLMLQQPQWFLKISEIQKKILKENEKTNWIPKYMKLRMKAWLEGISDWPVSRERYWGTPLPIWVCEKCKEKIVVKSIAELEKLSKQKIKEIHKPEIDKITIKCKCKGSMKRVSEVLDVWFDSGVSSWAALTEKEFKKYWPADINIEGKDQFRGWWNSEFILSEIKFNKKPFDSISVHGMVLDLEKRKMSKSFGNITSPQEIINKHSRDYLRYYFAKISKGEDFSFDEDEFKEIQKTFRVLLNVNTFISQLERKKSKTKINTEDKWILSKFNSLVKKITEQYNNYQTTEVIKSLEEFLIEDLSKTYIKIIRERADETHNILNKIRFGILKLLAPIIPFTTEKIWQQLKKNKLVKENSIHLSQWPKSDGKQINKKLEAEFEIVMQIIEAGLRERDKTQIGLKWPLAKAEIICNKKLSKETKKIILQQLNIKKLKLKSGKTISVKLDTKLTRELEAEGYARVLARTIQAERKKAGLIKKDFIELEITGDIAKIIEAQKEFIKQRVNAKSILFTPSKSDKKYSYSTEGKTKGNGFKIHFNKL